MTASRIVELDATLTGRSLINALIDVVTARRESEARPEVPPAAAAVQGTT